MSTPNQARTPDQLLRMFSQSRFLFGIAAAVVLHLVLIMGTSVGYLRDNVIDPEGAATRKQAAEAAANITPPPEAAPNAVATPAPTPTLPTEAVASPSIAPPTPELGSDEAMMKERADSPVIQSITETASPMEIPKEPADEGLSLDVTNPSR